MHNYSNGNYIFLIFFLNQSNINCAVTTEDLNLVFCRETRIVRTSRAAKLLTYVTNWLCFCVGRSVVVFNHTVSSLSCCVMIEMHTIPRNSIWHISFQAQNLCLPEIRYKTKTRIIKFIFLEYFILYFVCLHKKGIAMHLL